MSKIQSLLATESTSWVEFPDIEGFRVQLRFLSREDLLKIRKASLVYTFNKRTRQKEEEVDNDKFLERYTKKVIVGWEGLKVKDLAALLPVDMSHANGEEVVEYSEEEALALIKNSTIFDQFITDAMNDFEQFSIKKEEQEVKN